MYLFRCAAAFAVIHVDILHGDEGDAVFLSIGRGTAAMGRSPVYSEKGTEKGGNGNLGAPCFPPSFQTMCLGMDHDKMRIYSEIQETCT